MCGCARVSTIRLPAPSTISLGWFSAVIASPALTAGDSPAATGPRCRRVPSWTAKRRHGERLVPVVLLGLSGLFQPLKLAQAGGDLVPTWDRLVHQSSLGSRFRPQLTVEPAGCNGSRLSARKHKLLDRVVGGPRERREARGGRGSRSAASVGGVRRLAAGSAREGLRRRLPAPRAATPSSSASTGGGGTSTDRPLRESPRRE